MPEGAGEAFAESAGEAVQTAVMAFRLMSAIADAVRRQQQRKAGRGEELPEAGTAAAEASDVVEKALPPDIGAALLGAADWPQLAQQLMGFQQAGVDLEMMLPRVGEVAVAVRDQVAANAAGVAREGTDEWVKALRETLPAGPVREAILVSSAWPEMAATMARLDARGVNVRAVLAAAYEEGVGVDRSVAKTLAVKAPAMSRDARLSYGPLTVGLDVPVDLDLGDRERALRQLAISSSENQRFVRMVREAMPGMEREADALVAARQWPLVAARMADAERLGVPVAEHLAGLAKDTSWQKGPASRLVQAANDVLRNPVGVAAGRRAVVDTVAARSTSPSVGPTKAAAKGGATPEVPGVAAHREAGPAAKGGKTR
ncbi:hypothetical protein DCW30_22020 [Streptomyces alfalfae]|uniref:Uncharacterized protein n=2 Tax=Streptomyces alfalfae TaxID=1642299 RepID=A0ABN4VR11_9ACTN|nr:hypothetical protein A7J05_19265 [Streptomyces alfalfae]AYA17990.1 hypothetical protein D3X13_18670 [Streptomyces fradiae]RXX40106.1 hypothetical protein DCW30_22020 [Streptomyces alfalfae]RZM96646.1 hypothetical protein D4104_14485 [Streptomyces alfalfae]